MLGEELKRMRMLDLGIGGGRTTKHFVGRVREYVGVDYAPEMINVCRDRFPEWARAGAFKVCDARAMPILGDYFDFVLFSFNGIDYVPHEDRLQILREVIRVIRRGGLFVFSTHNLCSDVPRAFSVDNAAGVAAAAKQRLGAILFRLLNPHWYRGRNTADYLIINDGAHGFRLRTYYVRPSAQVRQLLDTGFRDVKVIGCDGKVLTPDEADGAPDWWLHYFATKGNRDHNERPALP